MCHKYYMNYIYGNNRYAIKSYWHDKYDLDEEMNKFVGSYVPNMFFRKGTDMVSRFLSYDKVNTHGVDLFIRKMIIAAHITWRNMVNFGGYDQKPINPDKIYQDIKDVLLDRVDEEYARKPGSKNVASLYRYCDGWKRGFRIRYAETLKFLDSHWDDTLHIPDEEIQNMFGDIYDKDNHLVVKGGYFYKKRRPRHEKEGSKRTDWSWMNGCTVDNVAMEIIRRGIELNDGRLKEALRKRKLTLKDVKKEIDRINEDKDTLYVLELEQWYGSMDDGKRKNVDYYINNAVTGRQDRNDVINLLVNVYGYDPRWTEYDPSLRPTEPSAPCS